MSVRIEHVEVAFAPRGILRPVWTKAVFAKVRPKAIDIRDVENQSAPASAGIALLKIQNGSSLLYSQRCKG